MKTAAVRSVLVVATRQIGDVLLTTPLLRDVRRRWPGARVEVLGFAGTLAMLEGNPDVDATIATQPGQGLRASLALLRRLWRRYDLAVVTDGSDRAHLIGWAAAPRRFGQLPASGDSNWWKRRLLESALVMADGRGAIHIAHEKQALLAPAGPWHAEVVTPRAQALPPALAGQLQPGAVVVHAPSMWDYKQWPVPHYRSVVGALLADGRQVVLTGSGSARDQEVIAGLRDLAPAPRLLDTSGQLNWGQLVTLLRGAALYIGPDTSVTHLAAATGVPVVAMFGPTSPTRWGPLPAGAEPAYVQVAPLQRAGNVTLLQASLPCVPCTRAGCDDHRGSRSDCLPAITPERVLEQAWAALRPLHETHA